MASEWVDTILGELIEAGDAHLQTGPFGTALKAAEYSAEGVPLISVGEIRQGHFEIGDKTPRVSRETAKRLPKFVLKAGDIVFGRKGGIDRNAIIHHQQQGWFLGSDGIRLRLSAKHDSLFFSYQMRSPASRAWLLQNSEGTTMPSLNQKILARVPIVLPPLPVQKDIAQILGTLDNKVELNRRMNATLEAMARALFQSWFVDFDPVRAKLDGRPPTSLDPATADIFPAHFQDSPLGPIPQGWAVTKIGEIAARIAMGPFGSRITRDNFVPHGVPVIRGGNLTDGFRDNDFVFLTDAKADELKSSLAHPLDIVFTHRGTLGQVGMIPVTAKHPRYIVSQSQMLLSIDRQKASPWMVYLFFRSARGEADLLAHTSTTGVPAISQPTTSLKAIQVVVPPLAVSHRFNELVQPLFLKREQNASQSRILAAIRDTLLPKLLSGELSAAEKSTENYSLA